MRISSTIDDGPLATPLLRSVVLAASAHSSCLSLLADCIGRERQLKKREGQLLAKHSTHTTLASNQPPTLLQTTIALINRL